MKGDGGRRWWIVGDLIVVEGVVVGIWGDVGGGGYVLEVGGQYIGLIGWVGRSCAIR